MTSSASFEQMVAEHQNTVLRVCRSILGDEHLGADAAQETFLRLWRQLDSGPAPLETRAWLRSVAITTALDRRKGRPRAETLALDERDRSVPALERTPLVESQARELRERYERALDELSESQRTIFLLRHAGEVSLSEVAAALGLALPTVKTHFARACLKLKHALRSFAP